MDTPLKQELTKQLTEKGLAESSIKLYLRSLEKLNDDNPLKNLKFLSDPSKIIDKLKDYKENTIRNYLIAVVSVLTLNKETKPGKKLYDAYAPLLLDKNKKLKAEESTNTKSASQEKNWVSWEDVEKKWNELKEKVDSFKSSKTVTEAQYNTLLQFVVLSLYFLQSPRRNEYMNMFIVKTLPNDTDKNYLDLTKNEMVFRKYKTAKKEGSITLSIPENLQEVINTYLKFHPLIKGKITKKFQPVSFLVYYDGKPFTTVNAITRILNSTFKPLKVSSSILRHSFLTSKFGKVQEEQKEIAHEMGHSTQMQKDYIKN